jgi:hypothetical protein
MGLDVLRALGKQPDAVRAWSDELTDMTGEDTRITAELRSLQAQLHWRKSISLSLTRAGANTKSDAQIAG